MTEWRWLSKDIILAIHDEQLAEHGGRPGIRDMGLLESAIAQPRATYGGKFLHEDAPTMAAAYLYHLVMDHPFVDGNKRVGAMAAFVFLDFNDIEFGAPEPEFQDLVLNVAAGNLNKPDVVAFFKRHVKA